MVTANLGYGRLVYMEQIDRDKYQFFYSAESMYICCYRKISFDNA